MSEWGSPEAGLPDKASAMELELWAWLSRTRAYPNPFRVVSDNRLAALTTETSTCRSAAPAGRQAKVEVMPLFREAF